MRAFGALVATIAGLQPATAHADGSVARATAPGPDEASVHAAAPSPATSTEVAPEAEPTHIRRRDEWSLRPIAIDLHFGAGTPLGRVGMAGEYSFVRQLSLGAGLGWGSGPAGSSGLHGAIMARGRPVPGKESAFVVGAAYSFGTTNFTNFEILGNPPSYSSLNAQWIHAELGWEYRGEDGFVAAVTLGLAWLLNPSALTCTPASPTPGGGLFSSPDSCVALDSETLATLDFTLGYAF